MNKKRIFIGLAGILLMAGRANASGFGLYEASLPTYALGGAVIGRAVDASANFHNPATLTDLTNVTVTLGFVTEHPRARIKVNGNPSHAMDPGVFWLPHFHAVVPLPWNLRFGLGLMPEYGLGSAYNDHWELANNSRETTVMSMTLNPNIAWEIVDGLSIGAGLRFLYFDFEQYSSPYVPALGTRFRNRLKGDNDFGDFGYQVGLKYDVCESFSVGAVYKSQTTVHVKGKTTNHAENPLAAPYAAAASGSAETELKLPQSITVGCNWDVTKTVRFGGMFAWTQWSSVDTLDFKLAGSHKDVILKWDDTYRIGVSAAWDFASDWTVMGSYVYETDCCGSQESTMLPAASRHMLSLGFTWRCLDNLDIGFGYGMILMDGKRTHARDAEGNLADYEAHRGISHAAGMSLTYRF